MPSSDPQPGSPSAAPASDPAAPQSQPPPDAILWVDDNLGTGQVIEHLLHADGFNVIYCRSSREALDRIGTNPGDFGLLMTDLSMPDLDGESLARAVLAIRPDLPVLVVTGVVTPRQAEALAAAGVREIIFKPVRREDLARTVARYLPPREPLPSLGL